MERFQNENVRIACKATNDYLCFKSLIIEHKWVRIYSQPKHF
jgi:hypothetical protein